MHLFLKFLIYSGCVYPSIIGLFDILINNNYYLLRLYFVNLCVVYFVIINYILVYYLVLKNIKWIKELES